MRVRKKGPPCVGVQEHALLGVVVQKQPTVRQLRVQQQENLPVTRRHRLLLLVRPGRR
jgi:hypothetical protein